MPLREAIHYASKAAQAAVEDGLRMDDVVLYYLVNFDFDWLVEHIRDIGYPRSMLRMVRSRRSDGPKAPLGTFVKITREFTAGFANATIACLRVLEQRPDVISALRLAAYEPATVGGSFFLPSYFEAAVEFARDRCVAFVPDPDYEHLLNPRGGATEAADVAEKFAAAIERDFHDVVADVARLYVDCVDMLYLCQPDAPSDGFITNYFRIAISQEANRTSHILFPNEVIKEIKDGEKPPDFAPETLRVIDLLRGGDKPGEVAARIGKSVGAVRQIKSRARRRGLLDS